MPFLVGFGYLDRAEKRSYSRIADAALFAQLAQCRLPDVLFRLYGAFDQLTSRDRMAKRKNFEAILVSTQNDRASFSRGDCHQPIRTSTSGSSIGAPSRRSLSTMFTKDNGVRRSKASCNSDSFHQRILSKTIASSASLIWDESARHERRNIARSGNNACCGN